MGVKNLLSLINTVIELNHSSEKESKFAKKVERKNSIESDISVESNNTVNTHLQDQLIENKNAPYSYRKFLDFNNKTIGIDSSLLIYQYVIGIRNTSDDLVSVNGKFTSHIHAVVSKALLYLDNKITPIFVFDGKPSDMKSNVLSQRRIERITAKEQMDYVSDEDEKRKLFKKSTIITYKQMEECKEILKAMGIPVIESSEEADSQLAYLTKEHDVYGAGSEDADLLAFGATRFLKNISSSKKNNIIEYNLINILKIFKLNEYEFIDLCILLGCDYVDVIQGLTPINAYEIITKHRSIVNFIKSSDSKKYKIPENYINKCISASKYFLDCPHNKVSVEQLKMGIYNVDKIKKLLIHEYSYSRTKVDKIITKLNQS